MVLSISNHNLHSYNMGFLCISLFLELHFWKTKSRHDSSGQSPKINPAKQKKHVQQFSPVFYFFITSKSTLFCGKKKCIKLGVLLCNSTVYIEILACIKTFVKATTSNTSKLRAVFVWDNIKNLGNIVLLSSAKIRNLAFIEIYDWYQTKLASLLYHWVLIMTGNITPVSCIITPTLIFLIKSIRPVSITVYNTKNSQPSIKSGDIFFKSSESNYQKAIKWHDF